MSRDQETTRKEMLAGRLEKAKGRLQQSSSEIQHRVRTSNAVEIAQSIFRQFADDIQLKDLLAKAEAFVAKAGSKGASPAPVFVDVTPSSESAGVKKTPSKGARPKK